MKLLHWLKEEGRTMIVLFLYFAFYFGIFIGFKRLILAHYDIGFYGLGGALLGALIAAKAVLILEKCPQPAILGRSAPAWKVVYETVLYTALALVFLYMEKSVELMHKEGSFQLAFLTARHEYDAYEFAAMVGWAGLSFLGYAVFSTISLHMGRGELLRLFFRAPKAVPHGPRSGNA